jgi:hypothetical protein
LNTREQQHAVIWTVTQLPYDALRVQPVPRPVGGCVLTCANAVIYLNQSVPAYGVCVNGGYRQQYTSFPMHSQVNFFDGNSLFSSTPIFRLNFDYRSKRAPVIFSRRRVCYWLVAINELLRVPC